jgi:hypothetical protein
MSIQSVALAEGGVLLGYNMNETSGTNLADFSGNSLPATTSTRGATNGSTIVSGMAASLTATGSAGSGNIATRAVAGGSAQQTPTGDISVCAILAPSASTPSGSGNGGMLGERANNWSSRRTAGRLHVLYLTIGGVLQASTPLTGTVGLVSGEKGIVWFRRRSSDGLTEIGTNNMIEDAVYMPGAFTATTDAVTIGTVSNNGFDGRMQGWVMFDHYVETGVFMDMLLTDPTLDYDQANNVGKAVFFDFAADFANPAVAASAEIQACKGQSCGLRMRTDEGRITSTGGRISHIGCRNSFNLGNPATISGSSVQDDYARRIEAIIRRLYSQWIPRTGSGKNHYWTNTNRWVHPSNPTGYNFYNECGIGVAGAALGRLRKLGPNDPMMKVAYAGVTLGLSRDYMNGPNDWSDNADFSLPAVGKILILLKDRMDKGRWQAWVDQFLAGCDAYYITGFTTVAGGSGPAGVVRTPNGVGHWYANGNRAWGDTEALYCAYVLDPTSVRLARYNAQVAWTIAPGAGGWQPGGAGSGLVYGYKQVTAPVASDWSDGKGYFREAHNGTLKGFWCNGGQVEGDFELETVNVDGFDKGYTTTQMERITTLYCFTRDPNMSKYANALLTQSMDNYNTGTGVVEGSYGSRHPADFAWISATQHVLTWRGVRSTNTFSAATLATMFAKIEKTYNDHGRNPNDATGRDVVSTNICSWLMGLDIWPGQDGRLF